MDANSIVSQLQSLASQHPYVALGLLLIIIGALIRGKAALVFYVLGALALIKAFGLFDTFVSFLKQVPTLLKQLSSGLGGV
ncbi:t26-9p [Thermococcus sp. 9N3]|uniref:t26-9p n=1 Tax=Thermococcus sp. 9N3 TaxID=163002 RepID=UPI001431812C|nr:t26-9p [Thermococcus sp. 9N3]NJE48408.1 t26-9p [Thermococcus sp. 9N3]